MSIIRKHIALISLLILGLAAAGLVVSLSAADGEGRAVIYQASGDSTLLSAVQISGQMLNQSNQPSFVQSFVWQDQKTVLSTKALEPGRSRWIAAQANQWAAISGLYINDWHYAFSAYSPAESRENWMTIRRYKNSSQDVEIAYIPVDMKFSQSQMSGGYAWSPTYILSGFSTTALAEHDGSLYGFVPADSTCVGSSSLFRLNTFRKEKQSTPDLSASQLPEGLIILNDIPLGEGRNLHHLFVHQDSLILISSGEKAGQQYETADKVMEITRYSFEGQIIDQLQIPETFYHISAVTLAEDTLSIHTNGGSLTVHVFDLTERIQYWGKVDITEDQLDNGYVSTSTGSIIDGYFYLAQAWQYHAQIPATDEDTPSEENMTVHYPDGYTITFQTWQEVQRARLMPRSSIRLTVYDQASRQQFQSFFDYGVNDDYLYRLSGQVPDYTNLSERIYINLQISEIADRR